MLLWAGLFLLIALVSGAFGFAGVISTATGVAQMLFVCAAILFGLAVLANMADNNHRDLGPN